VIQDTKRQEKLPSAKVALSFIVVVERTHESEKIYQSINTDNAPIEQREKCIVQNFVERRAICREMPAKVTQCQVSCSPSIDRILTK
jgi:protoheme ferro-lyase